MELFHLGKYSKRRRMLVDVIPVPSSWNVSTQGFDWPTEMKKWLGWYWTIWDVFWWALDWIFTPENFWGPWAAHCSRRKPLKGVYLSQFQNMQICNLSNRDVKDVLKSWCYLLNADISDSSGEGDVKEGKVRAGEWDQSQQGICCHL